jgi:hypothetical protein
MTRNQNNSRPAIERCIAGAAAPAEFERALI